MFHRHLPLASVAEDILVPVLDRIRSEMRIPADFPAPVTLQARRAVAQWRDFLATLDLDPDPGADRGPDPDRDPGVAPAVDRDRDPALVDHGAGTEAARIQEFRPLHPAATTARPASDALWGPALPALDATHIPFVTIDPEGSRDLDQAIHLLRLPGGEPDGATFLISYAIASVATFTPPDSPLDVEARARGLTTYFPDAATPLHPRELSEGAASLLPGQLCPACVWQIRLGGDGGKISWSVRRALVRSRAQLTYEQVQDALDSVDGGEGSELPPGTPSDLPVLLREVGELRLARERARGGVSARIPEQEVVRAPGPDGSGHFRLVYRSSPAVEEWNAQVSLLTGICAASTMRQVGCGILRTVPPATPSALAKLHAVARALGVEWPDEVAYPDLVRSISPDSAPEAAFLLEATSLFRGAGYAVFGVGEAPPFPDEGDPVTRHAAIAAEYAHATAPLRRLVDRWSLEVCLAACADRAVPDWVRASMPEVPSLMGRATQRVSAAERESLCAVEALLLAGEVGNVFRGAVVDVDGRPPRNGSATQGGNGARGNGTAGHGARGSGAGDTGAGTGATSGTGPDTGPLRPDGAHDSAGGADAVRGSGVPAGPDRAPAQAGTRRGTVMIADPAVMGRVLVGEQGEALRLGEVIEARLVRADVSRRRIEFLWPVGPEPDEVMSAGPMPGTGPA